MKLKFLVTSLLALSTSYTAFAETPFKDLLEGGNLDQWWQKPAKDGKGWSIEKDGSLHLIPGKTSISTLEKFKDFELVFEWKIAEGGNSGVFYRAAKGKSPEYQILDDENHVRGKNPLSSAAALYDLKGRSDDTCTKPYGEWNTGRIVAKGKQLQHWLNGVKVVDIEVGSEDWNKRYNKSKFVKDPTQLNPDYGLQEGKIWLQDHGGEVWYRNMKIRKLL